ncbi:hypothetical protein L2X98_19380 [Microbacterium elymi]|uniref:Uncharacterized protein n=1 Tax=Microbacterium elymi TaxID=2909587 RepID=A0ABY5NKA5_9MICO|nr:hypothetical protein [Microbacterium elymi]UUT35516.1 hypothetical protein L2X98_19380 [Microbacterium elymi]
MRPCGRMRSCAAAIEAIRPPYERPAANSGSSVGTDAATAAHAATACAAGPGIRRPACAYGNANRIARIPAAHTASAKPTRNG